MPNEDKTPEQPTKTGRRPGRPPKTTRTGPFGRGGGLTTKSTRFDPSLDTKTDPVVDPKTTTTRDPTPSPPPYHHHPLYNRKRISTPYNHPNVHDYHSQ